MSTLPKKRHPQASMPGTSYRGTVNALAIVGSSAFAGCNLFIGLSMGTIWLSLESARFYETFWSHFPRFVLTVIPLYLVTMAGLLLSARLDWNEPHRRRPWLTALALYLLLTLITMFVHLPLNLQIGAATQGDPGELTGWYRLVGAFGRAAPEDASGNRALWIAWHIPRVLLAGAISLLALQGTQQNKEPTAGG